MSKAAAKRSCAVAACLTSTTRSVKATFYTRARHALIAANRIEMPAHTRTPVLTSLLHGSNRRC